MIIFKQVQLCPKVARIFQNKKSRKSNKKKMKLKNIYLNSRPKEREIDIINIIVSFLYICNLQTFFTCINYLITTKINLSAMSNPTLYSSSKL